MAKNEERMTLDETLKLIQKTYGQGHLYQTPQLILYGQIQ